MIEFEQGGHAFRAAKLDAFKQFHVSRKISPLIPLLVPVFVKVASEGNLTKNLAGYAELLTPFAEALASMSDENAEYLLATCLSVVQRKQGDTWAPIWSATGKCCMFDDMDMSALLPLVVRVIQDSLGGFIRGMLTSQNSIPN